VSVVAAAAAIVIFVVNLAFAPTILPNCDYYSNIAVLNKAGAKAGGSEIVTIKDVKEISRSDTDVRCTGMARLNNSTDVKIDYRFFIEAGRLSSEAHWQ
jgi:hypothetical protein